MAAPLQLPDPCSAGADDAHLHSEHHGCQEEALQVYQEEEDEGGRRRHGAMRIPPTARVAAWGGDTEQEQQVLQGQRYVEHEQHEAPLVVLAHAVVDPGAVVVPPTDSAAAHGALVLAGAWHCRREHSGEWSGVPRWVTVLLQPQAGSLD